MPNQLREALETIALGSVGIGGIGHTLSRDGMQRRARQAIRDFDASEPNTDLVESLRDWAKAVESGECAKETIVDALFKAAAAIEFWERKSSG